MNKQLQEQIDEQILPAEKSIRAAREEDIPRIMELMASAKAIMRADGNLSQWSGDYPDEAVVLKDIRLGHCFVIEENGIIHGSFAYIEGIEPTYGNITGGQWIDDSRQYAVIHRIASTAESHGIAAACFRWCWEHRQNLRIDTHRDNHIMRHVIKKSGFKYCGIIYVADGSERMAFQKV